MKREIDYTYFQFGKEYKYPVFVRFQGAALATLSEESLSAMGFEKIEATVYEALLKKKQSFKLLNIVEATPQVAKHLNLGPSKIEDFGVESVTPLKTYQVYKYRRHGMMVFSRMNNMWELGLSVDFTTEEEIKAFHTIITRYLSLALASYGVISFWGVPVDEGVVVMKSHQSNGEAFLIDTNRMTLMTLDGEREIGYDFQVLRLDEILKQETKKMKPEELYSFLTLHTSYFSCYGPSADVKAMIFKFSTQVEGYVYPKENFRPRSDLSLG